MDLDQMRDHFAGLALPAIIARYPSASFLGASELAYEYADAMIFIRDVDPEFYGGNV
jgi:hypothetical protein